ncbi:MAG TPA: hypothetical protein PKU97_22710, partial [Kofleriaceae bacterium]|nr:hypothetical protein [Kofleriaceae bacterium]
MTHFVVTALDSSRSLPLHALGELIEHSAHRLHAQVAERAEHGTGVRAVLESGSTEPARAHAVS